MTTPDMLIRAQEPEDMTDLTELWNQPQVIWGTLQLPFTSVDARRTRAAAASASAIRLVAVIAGKVVGSSILQRYDARRAHVGSLTMAVHDAWAGRGVGSALMAEVVGLADRWLGLKRLELDVWADNPRAIALYKRFGFEREGLKRAEGFRDGAYVDAIAMARLRGL
jgi:L-phenylalanine/L-methionine N-acetyltransferase